MNKARIDESYLSTDLERLTRHHVPSRAYIGTRRAQPHGPIRSGDSTAGSVRRTFAAEPAIGTCLLAVKSFRGNASLSRRSRMDIINRPIAPSSIGSASISAAMPR